MRIVPVLGLLLALVFGLVAFLEVVDLQGNIAGLTSGGSNTIADLLPMLWMMLVGVVLLALVFAAVKLLG